MSDEQPSERREWALLVLAGIFVTHALLGELLGGKLVEYRGWIMSVGVIPWPLVFVTTDLVNEYFGPRVVRRLTLLTVGLILYAFVIVSLCMAVPAWSRSPVDDAAFATVLGQSLWIIAGSVTAFVASQLLDVAVFVLVRKRTGSSLLWLRAVGSTVVSQLVDTFVINAIAFGASGKLTAAEVVSLSFTNYGYKFLIALATLPLVYLGHGVMDRWLGRKR
jgi:uncharacterized integral membrane protein (TIGR00697 family)